MEDSGHLPELLEIESTKDGTPGNEMDGGVGEVELAGPAPSVEAGGKRGRGFGRGLLKRDAGNVGHHLPPPSPCGAGFGRHDDAASGNDLHRVVVIETAGDRIGIVVIASAGDRGPELLS